MIERAMVGLRRETAIASDVGLVRRGNQDCAGSDEAAGLFVVCDGMGGMAGGEVASRVAVDTFLQVAASELIAVGASCDATGLALRRAAAAANRAVIARAAFDTRFRGMGTTLVAARVDNADCTIVNVGDSRAYRIRAGVVTQLTHDHSYVAEQMRIGGMSAEEAAASPLQSAITRAIGAAADVSPDLFCEELRAGDTLLLCSDGLTRMITDEEIGDAFVAHAAEGAAAVCASLIESAKWHGGTDNITCVVVALHNATFPKQDPA